MKSWKLARVSVWPGIAMMAMLISGCGGSSGPPPDLSGTISIESGTRVDSDTADDSRLGRAVSNNSLALAQLLPSSGIIGGYLSASSGNYFQSGDFLFSYVTDPRDVYRISLSAGDRIGLQLFQGRGLIDPDVRMLIEDNNGGTVYDSDIENPGGPPFQVTVSEGEAALGPHVITLTTRAGGPFRYVMTVVPENSAATMATGYSLPEFRPDEAIVTFDSGIAVQSANNVVGRLAAAAPVALQAADARFLGGNAWRVRRNQAASGQALSAQSEAQRLTETLEWIRSLGGQPGVAHAEPNYLYRAQAVIPDDDPFYRGQWNYPLINLPIAWQVGAQAGAGVGIAVLDTGLFSMTPNSYGNWHPDVSDNVTTFTGQILDYVTGELDLDSQPGRDTNPADPGDGQSQSSNFHGTHVAGIAAAVDNQQGGLGVAPHATLYPVRVLGRDGIGDSEDLIAAINWAAGHSQIDVINLSLGGLGPSVALRDAVGKAFTNGKLVVAAAGNQATDQLTYPAAYPQVVGVGAVDGAKVRASYSNFGDSVDLVAPGGDASRDANLDGNADLIISAWGSDEAGFFLPTYAGLQGTSMAAPHVAGVYALMKAENPAITAADFFAWMMDGALTEPVGNSREYGVGLIDALKAVSAARDGNIPTVLAASPTAIQFSSALLQQDIRLMEYPVGKTALIQSITDDADWLKVDDVIAAGSGAPEFISVSVETTGLDRATSYNTELLIKYNSAEDQEARTLRIPVSLQLEQSDNQRDAGRHYVLLVSTDASRDTVQQAVVTADGGEYRYGFVGVPPGEYFLVAGSDMDNNGVICENGEACAEYPVNGLPEPIVIDGKRLTGVNLSTSFRRPTISTMGLPRYGFEGYRVRPPDQDVAAPVRRLEDRQ